MVTLCCVLTDRSLGTGAGVLATGLDGAAYVATDAIKRHKAGKANKRDMGHVSFDGT
jgi:hypothetical protein